MSTPYNFFARVEDGWKRMHLYSKIDDYKHRRINTRQLTTFLTQNGFDPLTICEVIEDAEQGIMKIV